MTAVVNVFLKDGVLDPQGKAAHHALDSLGFAGVADVRIGKQIIIKLDTTDRAEAETEVKEMFLRPVILVPLAFQLLYKGMLLHILRKSMEHLHYWQIGNCIGVVRLQLLFRSDEFCPKILTPPAEQIPGRS